MTKRNNTFSYLRALGALSIVFLHTFQYISENDNIRGTDKIISMIVRNEMMWAVPVFVMISGALLLEEKREISLKKLYSKYVLRVLVLLLAFNAIYDVLNVILGQEVWSMTTLKEWILGAFSGNKWRVLWYLYLLVAIYVMLPILRKLVKAFEDRDYIYLLLILLVFQVLLPEIGLLSGKGSGFYLLFYTIYPFYLFIGYALYNRKIRIPLWLLWVMAVAGTILELIITPYSMVHKNEYLFYMLSRYSGIVTIVQAVGIYGIALSTGAGKDNEEPVKDNEEPVKDIEESVQDNEEPVKDGLLSKLMLSVDSVTLGIYLVHYVFIIIINSIETFSPFKYGCWVVALLALGIFVVSWIICLILHSIPEIRRFI